ncbi:MAG: substrate-binding domain-containing protein [Clostridiales Family XIII bacterium]|jgi:phosphate transport system substrate-binding protein|nr:substrate-binding domain-containing protein [Clostridiales Family XIII bacterium]
MERIVKKEQKCNLRRIKRLSLLLALFCLLALTVACSGHDKSKESANEGAVATDLTVDADNPAAEMPAVSSSSSLRLMPEEFPHVDASTPAMPFSESVAAAVMGMPLEEARLYVLHNKTSEVYANLIDGRADIIFAAAPSEAELAYAKEQGAELRLTPILHNAFIFFVNAKNPVDGVGIDDIVGIYSDKIKNWKELGGDDAEIRAYLRPEGSNSHAGMLNLVMKETPIAQQPAENVCEEMSDIVSAVASYEGAESAIGYSYYYYAMNEQSGGKIKYLKIDGIAPDEASVADGSYPLVTTIYMALRQDEPADSATSKLAEWILSAEGQAIAENEGYVPIR